VFATDVKEFFFFGLTLTTGKKTDENKIGKKWEKNGVWFVVPLRKTA